MYKLLISLTLQNFASISVSADPNVFLCFVNTTKFNEHIYVRKPERIFRFVRKRFYYSTNTSLSADPQIKSKSIIQSRGGRSVKCESVEYLNEGRSIKCESGGESHEGRSVSCTVQQMKLKWIDKNSIKIIDINDMNKNLTIFFHGSESNDPYEDK